MKQLVLDALNRAQLLRPDHRDARRLQSVQKRLSPAPELPSPAHLHRAIEWLKRAQDACPDGGVSWGYCGRTRWRAALGVGWRSAYPETTGYIIETMIRYGKRFADADSLSRAKRMADWETRIQLDNGGIQGGRIDATPVAASTFVTGQVIFGWIAAYLEFGAPAYLDAARRAGDFLLSCLDEHGRFVKGYSLFCEPGPKAYEVRTGWALALLGQQTGDDRYREAARRMSRFALSCRRPNGWFEQNDLDDHTRPLTHTIGYVLEGVFETALLLEEPSWVDAVRDSITQIQPLVQPDGFLAGRWTQNWQSAVSWSCLTGSSQLALVCLRLHAVRPQAGLTEMAARLLGMVCGAQLKEGFHPGLLGGIHGSYPFSGLYGQYCVLNWAGKFFADAMLLHLDNKN